MQLQRLVGCTLACPPLPMRASGRPTDRRDTPVFFFFLRGTGTGRVMLQHPNIVRLCKAFVQHGNQTLFFVHEYFPGAQSVMQR